MSFLAIVSGASGKIGSHLLDQLNSFKINTLAITRSSEKTIKGIPNVNVNLLHDPDKLIVNWANVNDEKDIYFFHCAWSGDEHLTDGTIGKQLKNIEMLSNAIKIAKEVNCSKFINIGTTEELITKHNLENWQNKPNLLKSYGLSKLTSYYYAQILTYLNKIDLIHIRFSAAVNCLSSKNKDKGFIHRNIKNIIEGKPCEKISNKQLYDFIETNQLASLILETSVIGKNKEEYYLGPNFPLRLEEFFNLIKSEINKEKPKNYFNDSNQNYFNNDKYFSKTGKTIDFNIKNFI